MKTLDDIKKQPILSISRISVQSVLKSTQPVLFGTPKYFIYLKEEPHNIVCRDIWGKIYRFDKKDFLRGLNNEVPLFLGKISIVPKKEFFQELQKQKNKARLNMKYLDRLIAGLDSLKALE